MKTQSDYGIAKVNEENKIVYIRDLDMGNVSVTNDAEAVCKKINSEYPGYRIIYMDSEGIWSELVHNSGTFTAYGVFEP